MPPDSTTAPTNLSKMTHLAAPAFSDRLCRFSDPGSRQSELRSARSNRSQDAAEASYRSSVSDIDYGKHRFRFWMRYWNKRKLAMEFPSAALARPQTSSNIEMPDTVLRL